MPKPTFAPLKTAALAGLLAASACAADPMYGTDDPLMPVDPGPPTWPRGLHVVGTEIQDGANQTIRLYGVNRSGTEYQCVHSSGFFDGPSNEASVAAILNWPKVNAVRVPLNESCWLGINGAPGAYAGDQYKMAIQNYVNQLHKQHLIPILELHWVGPGTSLATRQQPMPDADHAPAFWADVAATFAADDGVVLEPYNEPAGSAGATAARPISTERRRPGRRPSSAPTRPRACNRSSTRSAARGRNRSCSSAGCSTRTR